MTTSTLEASGPRPLLRVAVAVHPPAGGVSLCVVTLVGDLDLVSAPRLRRATEEALPDDRQAAGVRDVVVDLTDVGFVDSAGLGALLTALRRTTVRGGRFAVVGASEQARRLLTLTGVHRVISLHATLAEAVAARAARG